MPITRVRTRPCFRNRAPSRDVIDDEDQLVIMVALEYLNVNASLGHSPRDR
ncbi:MAG: hypothetical protein ACREBG_24100 [Pyrinomonadaceae bacterium]